MNSFYLFTDVVPTSWTFYTVFGSPFQYPIFTVPQSGWYRIFCIGKSGDGAPRESSSNNGRMGRGGGGSGGMAVSILHLSKGSSYSVTTSNGVADFGGLLQATPGQNGGPGGIYMWEGGAGGSASGGNVANYSGFYGGWGGEPGGGRYDNGRPGGEGGNLGMHGGLGGNSGHSEQPAGGGGGGGARLPGSDICRYIAPYLNGVWGSGDPFFFRAGRGGHQSQESNDHATPYPAPTWNSSMILYGGGGGGGGFGYFMGSTGGMHSEGSPAAIIIERGV